ncbi:hypothetical protein SD37_11505 [Amycolatopsis orientalis]|uniref:Uncharacterized protein n=1 Tax=Amycolatopsis orientalis TaxID=31958 RepID=A0A193BVK6_AMYOR|nr:hypothetical protein [Amycolatopsis orientalis]ANN16203.1 hypothetical protein SD37_11505 [Amycolatopsis orientalis]
MSTDTVEMAHQGQLTVLNAGLTEHGAKTRDHRLALVAGIVGRPDLKSTKDLTRDEATKALRYLDLAEEVGEMQDLIDQYRPAVTS